MDGVVTDTAEAHAAAWKRLFDGFLKARAAEEGEAFRPFDSERDYRKYVDGKPRYDGVRAFLDSRGISLPEGREADGPDAPTVCGLGNRKDGYFRDWLVNNRARAYCGTLALVGKLKQAGIRTAVFSASRNAGTVLLSAGALDLFDAKVDGTDLAERGLPGKPDPAMLRMAAERLGIAVANAAVVEDAVAGIEAGLRGGFALVIGVDRGGNRNALENAGADFVIGDLSELALTPEKGLTVKTLAALPLFVDRLADIRALLAGKTLAAFFDYDGTLTPIVEDYTKALLPEEMRCALAELAGKCTVAVVSGRDVDVVRRLVGLETIYYAGSHGFQIEGPKGWSKSLEKGVEFLTEIDRAEAQLRERLSAVRGHAVERKRFSIAVHFRRAAEADVAQIEEIVDGVISENSGLRKGHGKKVFRVQPKIDWDKGQAVCWLLEHTEPDRPDVLPLYAGDDITDEDAFRALAGRGLTLAVRDEEDRPTAADYALAGQDDVKRLLEFLASAC